MPRTPVNRMTSSQVLDELKLRLLVTNRMKLDDDVCRIINQLQREVNVDVLRSFNPDVIGEGEDIVKIWKSARTQNTDDERVEQV
jgi:hypothetical protein